MAIGMAEIYQTKNAEFLLSTTSLFSRIFHHLTIF
jgi:hypothetical protein